MVLTAFGSCHRRQETAEVASTVLSGAFTYDTGYFTELRESKTAEFPVQLVNERYVLGIKKLSGIGELLQKEPESEFFKYFSGLVVRNLRENDKLELVEQETVEDFTVQNRPGVVQFLHMRLPENRSTVPAYIPADADEVYLYYFHYFFPPDYWYFAAVARQRLSSDDIAYIVKFIDRMDFTWQPAASEDGEAEP